jgi:hypothetical protein
MREIITLEGTLSETNFTLLDGSKVRFFKDKNNRTIVYGHVYALFEKRGPNYLLINSISAG